jgi:hypothetical protein
VLDRLTLALARKIHYAIRGWGTDEEYIWRSISAATLADISAVAGNAGLLHEVDRDLSGEDLHRFHGMLARRLWGEATKAKEAFSRCMSANSDDRAGRLHWIGDINAQRALLDAVIVAGNPADPPDMVIQAFQSYWEVETTVVARATAWKDNTIIAVHMQMKLLPSQDTRAGIWNELQLTGNPDLISRAAWNGSALIVGANIDPATARPQTYGYGSKLKVAAAIGDTTLQVEEGTRFNVGEAIAVEPGSANKDNTSVTVIAGNTLTVGTAMTKAHVVGKVVGPDDGSAMHQVPYLDAIVRHEIGHAVETALGGVTGFTVGLGGWWTGADIDAWANQMANPWTPKDGTTISADDLQKIKDVISDAVKNRKGSLNGLGLDGAHPVIVNLTKIPAIIAAENCLSKGDNFYQPPASLYLSNGKRFSCSWWYRTFMVCNDDVVNQRVTDYTLYAPAEFFAEAYTVFYEEASLLGTSGFTEAELGRRIRNAGQREWIRTNVHNRGYAPAAPAGSSGPSPTVASGAGESHAGTARPGSATYGKHGGNPGP